jgi:hypothetical protein
LATPNLEDATDRLYAASLPEFVSERARLATELRDAGNREDAAALAKLKKPNVAAWVLNQLARRNRRDVDLLLDAGHRLREAQSGVLRGAERESFEQARNVHRDALRRLVRDAEELLVEERGGASASVLNQIAEALRAAAISEPGRELLARGRFVEPPRAEGFDVVSALAGEAPPQTPQRPRTPDREEQREAREALRAANARLRDAERDASRAEQAAEKAHAQAEKAAQEAQAARERADAAAAEVEEAERRVDRSKRR